MPVVLPKAKDLDTEHLVSNEVYYFSRSKDQSSTAVKPKFKWLFKKVLSAGGHSVYNLLPLTSSVWIARCDPVTFLQLSEEMYLHIEDYYRVTLLSQTNSYVNPADCQFLSITEMKRDGICTYAAKIKDSFAGTMESRMENWKERGVVKSTLDGERRQRVRHALKLRERGIKQSEIDKTLRILGF